jgi:RNA polymerase sigma-70 factor (ECF subfamily)
MNPKQSLKQIISEALKEAYEVYSSTIFGHLMTILKNKADSWDILQETFIRYVRYLSKGNEVRYPQTFLYRTATRLAIRYIKRSSSKETPMARPPEVGEYRIDQKIEMYSMLENIWGKLDLKSQIIAKSLILDEMTDSEIAKNTGFSRGSVRRRIKKIREVIGEYEKK